QRPFDARQRLPIGTFTVIIEDLAYIQACARGKPIPGSIAAFPVAARNAGDMSTMPLVVLGRTDTYKRFAMDGAAGKIGMCKMKTSIEDRQFHSFTRSPDSKRAYRMDAPGSRGRILIRTASPTLRHGVQLPHKTFRLAGKEGAA